MRQSTGNLHDAEDLVQETFVKAYQNIQRYRSSFKFSTWLFTIARRLAVSYYRSRQKSRITGRDSSTDLSPFLTAAEKESRQGLWALAGSLSENQYQALWLKYAEDMSIKEISRIMGKSQVGVKVLLYRARKNLVGRLKKSVLSDELAELTSYRHNLHFFES